MDSLFKISKFGKYGIIIEGLELDNNEYLPEDGVRNSIRNYRYSDSVTVNLLYKVSSTNNKTYVTYDINTHNNITDSSVFNLNSDGLYMISHIILPNKSWFDYMMESNKSDLMNYTDIVYSDGTKVYKYENNESIELDIKEILNLGYDTSTIVRNDKNTFIIYFINECFSKICKDILNLLHTSRCKPDQDLIFTRDLLWMGINVIKYNIEMLHLFEAQRVLEQITGCYFYCNDTIKSKPCGCNN